MDKDYLRVDTGEPYQPVRLTYYIADKSVLFLALDKLACVKFDEKLNIWLWQRTKEVSDLQLLSELDLSIDALPEITLGTLFLENGKKLYINFPSFERAYLAIPYFYRWLRPEVVQLTHADLYNSFTDVKDTILLNFNQFFNEHELSENLQKRRALFEKKMKDFQSSPQQSLLVYLNKYANFINEQPLLKQERYLLPLDGKEIDGAKMLFFTNGLLMRELIAREHWFGNKYYTLKQAAQDLERKS